MTKMMHCANVYRMGTFVAEAFSFFHDHAVFSDSVEYFVFPGFADVHVHLREPGFSYKETILTGTRAAARGGFTAVCSMANLSPVPDTVANLQTQLDMIDRDACILVKPMGAITVGEKGNRIADLEGMAPMVSAFSDDGCGVADAGLMREAMQRAHALGKVIAAHCEDTRYLPADPRSEWSEVERDILLAADTGAALHVCHVSSEVSLSLIRQAKRDGIDVSCETAPHYLLLDETMCEDFGKWKMNPPLRSPKDKAALIEAVLDGTVDMIATDHAPHSAEEKSRGFEKSLNGIVGLECAFPVLYTGLVREGILSIEDLVRLMSINPRQRFSLGGTEVDIDAYTVWAIGQRDTVDPSRFLSMGRCTPFEGMNVYAACAETVYKNRPVWSSGKP
ncbi:MAG: dihydroorotase [Clostridia bacterium]|nr:dihydroorotase [Clostridia bacterium]